MKKLSSLVALMFFYALCSAQNVGIGTLSPSEKLDVNGNLNVTGQVKVNGNAGASNQVFMKDATNNLVWGNLNEFKNIQVFDCAGLAFTLGAGNCSDSWIVPGGVTTALVECWGGGGGGSTLTGGGGGGYISARLTVTPGNMITLSMGAGGNYGSATIYGINGGTTTLSFGGTSLQATGGQGGSNGDPLISASNGQAQGGTFTVGGIGNQFIGYYGSPDKSTVKLFTTTEYCIDVPSFM